MLTLDAVVAHTGVTLSLGHYHAYLRESDNQWFCVDDGSVSPVTLSEVLATGMADLSLPSALAARGKRWGSNHLNGSAEEFLTKPLACLLFFRRKESQGCATCLESGSLLVYRIKCDLPNILCIKCLTALATTRRAT